MSLVELSILAAGLLLEATVFLLAYRVQHSKAVDWLLYLLSLDLFEAPCLISIYLSGQVDTYYYAYWAGEALDTFFRMMLVFRAAQEFGTPGRRYLRAFIAVAAGATACIYPVLHSASLWTLDQIMVMINLFAYMALAVYILLGFAGKVIGNGISKMLLTGMLFYATLRAVEYIDERMAVSNMQTILHICVRVGYLLVLFYWVVSLAKIRSKKDSYGY